MYIYQADVLCDDCADDIKSKLARPKDMDRYDSDEYPKGPYNADESDSPQHCGHCQEFLENPLTTDGIEYVRESIEQAPNNPACILWADYYSDCL